LVTGHIFDSQIALVKQANISELIDGYNYFDREGSLSTEFNQGYFPDQGKGIVCIEVESTVANFCHNGAKDGRIGKIFDLSVSLPRFYENGKGPPNLNFIEMKSEDSFCFFSSFQRGQK